MYVGRGTGTGAALLLEMALKATDKEDPPREQEVKPLDDQSPHSVATQLESVQWVIKYARDRRAMSPLLSQMEV